MITLAELKEQARQRSDMENSEFVSDAELTQYINSSLAELHDLLIAAYNEDYVMNEHIFASTSAIQYDLPADFYKLRGVDVRQNTTGNWATVKRFNFNRRNEQQNAYTWNMLGLPYMEYRLVGSKIRFNRTPDVTVQFRIFYYPAAPKLVLDTDAYDDVNGFAEYVVVDAAIKMMQKEESDVRVLLAQKSALAERIRAMAAGRDANEPASVTDIYAEDTEITLVGNRQVKVVAGIRDFKKVAGGDEEFSKLQERLQEFFQPIIACALLDGTLLTNVVLSTTATKVEHKLRRPVQGWIVVRKNAAADIFEPNRDLPTTFLTLQASAAVTVDLWVF